MEQSPQSTPPDDEVNRRTSIERQSRWRRNSENLKIALWNRLLGLLPRNPNSDIKADQLKEASLDIFKVSRAMRNLVKKHRHDIGSVASLPDRFSIQLPESSKRVRVVVSMWTAKGDEIAPSLSDVVPSFSDSKEVRDTYQKGTDRIVLPAEALKLLEENDTFFALLIPMAGHGVRRNKLEANYCDYDIVIGTMFNGKLLYRPALLQSSFTPETVPPGTAFNSEVFALLDENGNHVIWESSAFRDYPFDAPAHFEYAKGMEFNSFQQYFEFATRLTRIYILKIKTEDGIKQHAEATVTAPMGVGTATPQPIDI